LIAEAPQRGAQAMITYLAQLDGERPALRVVA
jgi:hypothetical protein